MRQRDYYSGKERRKYIRLDSVFSVQFRLLSADAKVFLSEWLQGFTNNIGKGGICLDVHNLKPELAQLLKNRQAKVSLSLAIPITKSAIPAEAQVAWVQEIAGEINRYLIGLSYEKIDPRQNNKIIRYTWTKKLFVPVLLLIILILGLGFALTSFINARLARTNRLAVEQLVKILQETSIAKQKIRQVSKEREDLQLKIQALESRMQAGEKEKSKSRALIERLGREKAALQAQLAALQRKESSVTGELLHLDQKKANLQKANFEKMYQWLKVHQNPRTGLVMSFEGDKDIENWGFIYDQALAIIAYARFADFPRAKKILDFFQYKAKRADGRFFNSYYVDDASPAEYLVHSGPNIWLGIAAVEYTQKSQDQTYLALAEEIARATMQLQNQDREGGIRGGPSVEWYATEHNLDAYAFFNMLYKVTVKEQYAQARDKVLGWLVKHTYDKTNIPIQRGKGDSTIATDTYAWSIASLGPQKLEELGMNPDRIMEFAEENCSVEVSYTRPDGINVKIKGFDFAAQRHLARGGVVSSEWTAQMILAFWILADFYDQKNMPAKARAYEAKADAYLAELAKMIISSPSPSGQGESCLPYASEDYVDTGHGWMTPKGSRTGSVAGTVYAIFAYYKYNPLALKE